MSSKVIHLESVGPVTLSKRRGSRNIRISLTHKGEVRVSLPTWVPYKAGELFAQSKIAWIRQHVPEKTILKHGYRFGKAHHLVFEAGQGKSISTRISGNQARVLLPLGVRWEDDDAQKAAEALGVRVLKKEARQLLPRRLQELATKHGYAYRSVSVRQLSGRWGSCSSEKDIILNCFLMQLPWELIDYVLLHELAHTKVMAHGKPFWAEMSQTTPELTTLRSQIKLRKPVL